ncbi:reactive chlorine resistance oxidoreductase RclA [Edwardsiella anguillarum]|uniref:reactive chlorine resistance oxidoreductase RclA n=1 Tax=Edwardsiella TaxID=635 RepID=UPI00045CA42D|nr:reactive chlorine resistance oxidoreductase RclA [Edwardsiella anguillarum]AKM48168.1 pyridine nucleotide-disulfide oxidoreductase [Edwardsiella sp. EA181011]GAJ66622.1 pyridine nucleotide-disulfide oxidoreductase [Edwardsiella piscicida]RFT03995.1 pyridine nucleotide-disulfide oxidoreductase [Edwardsiella anguillarum]WHP81541.1 reactive chlorine resistance oxidoreductase RclA [Edwardsiella anguillarum]WHQ19043.1 reactive chlorine resistance oxidoreductase RclA [Edwardsiella anguillarum]
MTHFQNVVIGFGKAGKTLAAFLARRGEQVALIERSAQQYGGTCINVGCIPTKSWVHDADTGIPFAEAVLRQRQLVEMLRENNRHALEDLAKVTLINGHARFVDAHTLAVQGIQGEQRITAERIFINTGARSAMPAIEGLAASSHVYDSTSFLQLATLPQRLVILGAGYIGVEFASLLRRFGAEVTVLEAAADFLPREDRDIAQAVETILRDEGIDLRLGGRVRRIEDDAAGVTVELEAGRVQADAVLVASGRLPNSDGLALEQAGVEVDARGAIKVNGQLQTTQPHIWALGDVNGGPQFTFISLDDFRIVRDSLYGKGLRHTGDRGALPYSVFMTPTLSRIGLSEAQARAQGEAVTVVTLPVGVIPRARTLKDPRGVLKAVVQRESGRILGAALLCRDSHEMINLLKTAMDAGVPYSVLRDQIYTHPTMSEAFNDLFALVDA